MRPRAALRASVAPALAFAKPRARRVPQLAQLACVASLVSVAFAAYTPRAMAQADGPEALEAADRAFKQALAEEQAGQCDKAVAQLEQARALAHKETAQLLFHLGVCHARLGRLVAARDELRVAVERAQAQGLENVAKTAKAQLDAVLPRVATLSLGRPVAGAVKLVAIDGVDSTSRIGARIDLDPGDHRVEVSYAAGPVRTTHVTLREGEHADLAWPDAAPVPANAPDTTPPQAPASSGVPPAPVASGPATSATAAPPEPLTTRARSGLRTSGWIVGGTGVALLAGATAFWVLRDQANTTLHNACTDLACPPSYAGTIHDGKLFDAVSVSLFVVGGAALLSGTGLVLLGARSYADPPTTGVHLVPLLGQATGLGVRGALW